MLAVPPPRSETVRPGGVWLAKFVLLAPIALGRPAVFVRPAVLGRAAVFVRPLVIGRLDGDGCELVAGRFIVDGRELVVCDAVELCDCAALCEVECEELGFDGALGFDSVLC